MDNLRWERIQALFHDAVDLPADERLPYLERSCPDDPTLVAEVLATIAEDERGTSLLDRGVSDVAAHLIGNDADALRQIGPYRIVRVLGEGGMGIVFLAERSDLGSPAAIKILRDAWLSPARRRRFSDEQRALAKLNSPLIARLYDAGTLADGTPWIVMEHVNGVSLTDYCDGNVLPLSARIQLFRQVCEAVQHAHRHLIVHGDLKPSNILVTADGTVKLLDFGVSKQLTANGSGTDQTQLTIRMMTPAYAAPEQLRGEATDVLTDVFSLGVILYELIAGRRPETADQLRWPTGGRHATDLDVLCLTAMHPNPTRRYQSVEALIRDLDHYGASRPLDARPDSSSYRAGKFLRRHWKPLAAAAVVVVAIGALTSFYTIRLAAARNTAILEVSRTARIQRLMLDLFTGGDTAAGPSEDLRVRTVVDRGLIEVENLAGDPIAQADLRQTLGSIYQKLGDLPRAESLLQAALSQRRTSARNSQQVADTLIAMGLLRLDQARMDEAERLVREALEMTRQAGADDGRALAKAETALGQVLVERGEYAQATSVLEQAIARQPETPPTTDLATSLRLLAGAHFYAGNYSETDALTRRAIAITRTVNGARHPLVAEDLINLGAVQHERGQYAEAERYYREALAVTEGWFGKEHHQTASNLTMLGRSLVYQKKFDDATVILERALAIQERVFGRVHPRVASVVNDLGNIAVTTGRLDAAAAAFTRMAAIYAETYGPRHYLVATARSNLAGVFMARKDYGTAEGMYRDAIALYTDTLSPTHLNTGIARLKLGRSLARQRRFEEAERELLGGYGILSAQTSPSVSWLKAAREDLAALFDATGQPARAAEYRAALTSR